MGKTEIPRPPGGVYIEWKGLRESQTRSTGGILPPSNASPGGLGRLCFLEIADGAFERVAATWIAETYDMAAIFGG